MFSTLLLLSLVVSCEADFFPPVVNVSLDDPPEVRWASLFKVFDVDYLQKAGAEVIDTTVPKWVHHAITPIVEALEKFCTSIVAQDTSGRLYHGRNLDYPHDILRNLTINILFLKNGTVAYRGTSFAGYIGLWTGQSPNKFTISGDQRGEDHWWNWWKNWVSAFLLKRSPVSWLVRETLEEAADFQDAVMRLSKIPIITSVYYIVAGVKPGEGVVVTRDRKGPADIWPLEPLNGGWFRVETNFDHWLPPPAKDHRRDAANKALNATGQDNINMNTMFKVLSMNPVCSRSTVYTTTMSAASPEKYNTKVRLEGCHSDE
ncbi:N-acylethanolamine-hydrolyzing acid amidase isoform X3 [Coregonus clupeaformis]|uniref:N-acylethanolamine-hydrolyzing acid amidase isoform X3 n=1 Tax=Coregonus clupeaformis TaxID=59861 RepID=UPI001BE017CC|nr:N-acylethanolamine-hydrolyzing acid amidase isoform X3 [Coregonus clupeaformis]